MYDLTQINKMDFKELRNAVQELYDNYVKMKRLLEDTLNNIDESNLATTFRKKVDGYESMFKITAESIESKVSYQDLENNLTQYSTIKQTAKEIAMSVVQNQEYTDKATQEMSSSFTMTADRISTNVVRLNKKVDGNYTKLYSSITQTAEAIASVVGKELTEYFVSDEFPPTTDNAEYDEEILCEYNGVMYYYNKIAQAWLEYTGPVNSAFTQTADGFILNGCVEVQGRINMAENAYIGRKLILQDQNQATTNPGEGLTISVDTGVAQIIGNGSRSLYLAGSYITLYSTSGNRLVVDSDGLKYNGVRVLTENDMTGV